MTGWWQACLPVISIQFSKKESKYRRRKGRYDVTTRCHAYSLFFFPRISKKNISQGWLINLSGVRHVLAVSSLSSCRLKTWREDWTWTRRWWRFLVNGPNRNSLEMCGLESRGQDWGWRPTNRGPISCMGKKFYLFWTVPEPAWSPIILLFKGHWKLFLRE